MNIQQACSLKPYNSFGFDQTARYLVVSRNQAELAEALAFAEKENLPVLVLGGGSNIVLQHAFDGVAIVLAHKGIDVQDQGDKVYVTAEAGENWHQLVSWCLEQGYYGLENLSLIPGCVGAAPIQNIGAYGVELKDCFVSLEALERQSGEVKRFSLEDCQFGYRDSVFKGRYKDEFVILRVTLALSKTPDLNIEYAALKALAEKESTPTPLKVAELVCEIRRSKLPDPEQLGNAGSFFKNAIIPETQAVQLKQAFPEMVIYPDKPGFNKVASAWLVEACGFKGHKQEGVGVHDRQAIVLVNHGAGTGEALMRLAREIQGAVEQQFGISLEIEPRVY